MKILFRHPSDRFYKNVFSGILAIGFMKIFGAIPMLLQARS
jgi:hypothetical protein